MNFNFDWQNIVFNIRKTIHIVQSPCNKLLFYYVLPFLQTVCSNNHGKAHHQYPVTYDDDNMCEACHSGSGCSFA